RPFALLRSVLRRLGSAIAAIPDPGPNPSRGNKAHLQQGSSTPAKTTATGCRPSSVSFVPGFRDSACPAKRRAAVRRATWHVHRPATVLRADHDRVRACAVQILRGSFPCAVRGPTWPRRRDAATLAPVQTALPQR